MTDVIEYSKQGAIGVITIKNPPANALSFAVTKGIDDALAGCLADDDITAIVVTGAGRMFVAGADIREFSMTRPDDVPELPDVIDHLESSPKPIVAAMNGLALGGGMELAMGCHYRLAAPTVSIGQPEVKLGLIPGAGGTQRLPRLIGVEAALDAIVGGDPISAKKALELGALDEIVEGDLVARAIEFASTGPAPRPTGEINDRLGASDAAVFEAYRKKIARSARGMKAPYVCIDTVEIATKFPIAEGLKKERVLFEERRASDESSAMRYMFFAEREAAKIPDVPRDTQPYDVKKAAVIGSGLMGGGIAMNFANAGIPVTILDISEDALAAGLEKIKGNYAGSVSRGRFSQDEMDKRMALIQGESSYDKLADADIVIEAVFEKMELKKEIFAELDKVCKPDAVLASNTSSLDINEIASATSRPAQVCGTHFFSPANVMKLMENVRADETSNETIATIMGLSKKLNKVGVLVGVGDGFVGNRMLHVAARVADFMIEEGAMPWDVDRAIYDFGFPMGPFAMNDLAGIDVRHFIRQAQASLYPGRRQSLVLDRVHALGRYGQKTNAGWYKYEPGSRTPTPDPEIEALIKNVSAEAGIERRDFTDDEIRERYLVAIINQGAHVLDEGLALRASDIDVVWHYGYGFPRYHGGPMFYADTLGLGKVLAKVQELEKDYGDWLKPAECLKRLAAEGKGFKDL
ncbi:MAG: 3-hydroxyacyl-CoA dehydrogenase NAD-binding domain-containing protein [Proteobacteria bacterium]|nr:3-hydroxyacyl-CoA dehydrogenase NAD-binding domain-containing protein [Pseudomonadota bacterium]